ncbi:uncharacterized protein LOC102703627 isoform X3 [Oryza brachyantha]|uniref:uncharacterized protein LOC102703627 isoform X3 n=1 Tax=Oryza brachyantha TaxID=4533 RepID=UPI0007760613|nr:uncharacterized protein LOC102703627 isoform X3 [Oryza brachyantha]
MPQPAFFRSPPPLPHLQPPRGFHVDLAARHKALLEEDVALKRFKSYKSKAKQVLRARNALTSVVLCVPFGVPYQNNRRIPTMRVYCTADEEVEEVSDLGVNVALSMLKFYKREISPLLPSSCRYVPTCSEYSMQAYKKYGVAKGTILTAWRLCRCNPLGGHGYDPPRWFGEEELPKE